MPLGNNKVNLPCLKKKLHGTLLPINCWCSFENSVLLCEQLCYCGVYINFKLQSQVVLQIKNKFDAFILKHCISMCHKLADYIVWVTLVNTWFNDQTYDVSAPKMWERYLSTCFQSKHTCTVHCSTRSYKKHLWIVSSCVLFGLHIMQQLHANMYVLKCIYFNTSKT